MGWRRSRPLRAGTPLLTIGKDSTPKLPFLALTIGGSGSPASGADCGKRGSSRPPARNAPEKEDVGELSFGISVVTACAAESR